jgi:hypothetical protein
MAYIVVPFHLHLVRRAEGMFKNAKIATPPHNIERVLATVWTFEEEMSQGPLHTKAAAAPGDNRRALPEVAQEGECLIPENRLLASSK